MINQSTWQAFRKTQEPAAPTRTAYAPASNRTHSLIPRPGSVLVVDAYPLMRLGMKSLLAHFCQCQRVGEADPQSLVAQLEHVRWNMVMLGWGSGQDGLAQLKLVKTQQSSARVLLVSDYGEPEYAVKALRAGASGYLQRLAPTNEILRAVSAITNGESHVYPALPLRLASNNGDRLPHEKLSGREREVFTEMIAGRRICEIAGRLKINAKTVSTYRGRVLSKMGMHSDADMIAYAVRHCLK